MGEKITTAELAELFGESMPFEVVTILQTAKSAEEARAAIRELVPAPPADRPPADVGELERAAREALRVGAGDWRVESNMRPNIWASDGPVASTNHEYRVDKLEARAKYIAAANPAEVLSLLARLSEAEARASRAEAERDEARAGMAHILDNAVYGDSYGVHGSDFLACRFCTGGGAPGVAMEHEADCPVARYPNVVDEWFAEMAEADQAAQSAESRLAEAEEALEGARFLIDRINELDWCDFETTQRDWNGHVEPALARLSNALAAHKRIGGAG